MNKRLAKIRIKAKFHNISLFCEHAPTELNNGAVKDAFYANLDLYDKCPADDIKIVLEDFNAKISLVPLSDSSASGRIRATA